MKCKMCGWFEARGPLNPSAEIYVEVNGVRVRQSKVQDIIGYCKARVNKIVTLNERNIRDTNRCLKFNSKEYVEELRLSNKSW